MNNERAIELLHRLQDEQFDSIHGDERREALSMAVRALEGDGDAISRQAAIEIVRNRVKRFTTACVLAVTEIEQLPPAQRQRILYANMSDTEFEKWLYEHGICNPNIHESIPCDAVPLLIDNAISELPSAQPEPHWIPCSERLPNEDEEVLVTSNYGILIASWEKMWDNKILWFEVVESKSLHKVTAWMPLPEPYGGESDEL